MRSYSKMKKNVGTAGSLTVQQAVHRAIHSRPGGLAALLTTAAIGLGALSVANAGPQGGVVTAGQGSISTPNASTTVIQQGSNVLGLDWQSFNVGAQERVQFNQPSSSAVALNRILDQSPSQIFGRVDANGRVVLLNPNGIVFGRTAQLNVGSLVASSLKLANFDPVSGRMSFDSDGNAGAVTNSGTINAAVGGSVALLGGRVTNDGLIVASYGSVALGAGKAATLDFTGDGLLQLQVTGNATTNPDGADSAVANSGAITANGGTVLLTAQAAKDVFTNVLNNTGVVRASRIENVGGEIRLLGTGGAVVNSGTLDASGAGSGSTGGSVQVLGDAVALHGASLIDVSGDAGGGTARVGGNFHGANPDPINATTADVSAGSRILADARTSGDAGSVVVWSDGTTSFDGTISARALGTSGRGGNAEVSGKQHLAISGHAALGGANGADGTLLLDPGAVDIVNGANNTTGQPDSFKDAWIVDQLDNAGGTGTNVTITTANGTAGAQNLTVQATANVSWTSAHNLTLIGNNSITTAAGSVINNSGTGNLTLTGGAVTLGGTIGLTGGALQVTGNGAIDLGAANVGGNLTVNSSAGGITNTGGAIHVGGTASFTANGGGESILVNHAGNSFASTVSFAGASLTDVSITDSDATPLTLPALTLSGNLNVTGNGGIAQSAPLNIGGTTTLASGGADTDLTNVANVFTGTVSVTSGRTVSLRNSVALDLGASNITNAFNVTAGDNVTQSGSLTVGGTATFDADVFDVTLTDAANDFGTVVVPHAGNASFRDANALRLGAFDVTGGNVSLQAGSILNDNDSTTRVIASQIVFNSAGNIGAAGTTGSIDTGAGNLSVTSPGNVYISNNGSFGFNAMDTTGGVNGRVISIDALGGTMTLNGHFSGVGNASIHLNNLATNQDVNYSAEQIGDGTSDVAVLSGRNLTMGQLNGTAWSLTAGGASASTAGDLNLTDTVTATGAITASAKGAVNSAGNLLTANTLDVSGATIGALTTSVSNLAATSGAGLTVVNTGSLALAHVQTATGLNVTSTGSVTQQGGQDVTVSAGTATFTAANNGSIMLGSATNNFASGTVNVSAASGNLNNLTIANTAGLAMSGMTLNGALNLTAGGSGISQTGAFQVTGGTTTLSASGTNINLGMANDFGTVQVAGGNTVTLHDANTLTLGNTTASTLNVQTSGALLSSGTVSATSATLNAGVGNNITLNNAGNTLGSVTITQAANVTLNNSTGMALATSAPVSSLSVTAAGNITNAGTVAATSATLSAGNTNDITMTMGNTIGTLSIGSARDVNVHNTGALTVGTSTLAGTLALTTVGDITNSGNVSAANAALDAGVANINLTGANSLGGVSVAAANNVTVNNTTAMTLGASTVTNALQVTTTGNITNTGAVSAASTRLSAGNTHDITLTGSSNNLGVVRVDSARNVSLTNSSGVVMDTSTVAGALNITATAGNITDSGTGVTVTGATTFNAGGGSVTFNKASTNLAGAVNVTNSSAVTLVNAGALDLGNIETATLVATASTGGITSTGALAVSGAATFTTSTAGQSIVVNNASNDFAGPVTFNGASLVDVRVANSNAAALDLSALVLSGALDVTANGVTQSGALNVAGPVNLFAPGKDVILNDAANQFGSLAVTARNVTVQNTIPLNLGGSAISGALAVVTAGDITGTGGSVVVNGTTDFTPGATHNVLLNDSNNNFVGAVTVHNGNNVALVDTNALALGDVSIGGNLNATAGGTINAAGVLNVAGNTVFTANGSGSSIFANNAGNVFSGTVSFAGAQLGSVGIADTTNLDLQGMTLSGDLNVAAAGITSSGPLSVGGTTTLTAGAGNDVVLVNAGNNFNSVAVTSARDVTLQDANGIDLGTSTLAGVLNVTANGAITDSGAISATSATFAAGAGNDITIDNPGTLGAVSFTSGRNVILSTTTGLNVGTSTVGSLDLTASGGDIVSTGALTVGGATTLRPGGHNVVFGSLFSDFQGPVNVVNGGLVQLTSAGALNLGNVSTAGNLNVTATTGDITNSGVLDIGGSAFFTASGGGRSILVNNAGNNFAGQVSFSGPTLASIAVSDSSALALEGLALSGSLSVTAAGITQSSGTLNVGGVTTLAAGSNDITLASSGNDFGALAITSANNVALQDLGSLAFGTSVITGALQLTNGGPITQTGDLHVGGATTFTTGGDVTLARAGNDFGGAVNISNGGNVALVDANALELGTISTANLTATAGGSIASSGPLTVTGNSAFLANGIATSITVNNAANNFGGTVSFGGTGLTNVAVTDTTSLDLQGSTLAGNLSVTAAGITDSGALVIGGTTTLNAGANDVVLDSAANDFNALAVTTARNVTLIDANAITLGMLGATGNTSITAGGAISDDGSNSTRITGNSLVLRGASIGAAGSNAEIDTSVSDITATATAGGIYIGETDALTLTANATGGPINVSAGGALTLGTVNAGTAAVSLTANGALSDGTTGNSITAGALTLSGTALGSSGNRLDTSVSSLDATAGTGGLFLTNAGALALNAAATSGAVDVTNTAGAMTVSSVSGSSAVLKAGGGITFTSIDVGSGAASLTAGGGILDGTTSSSSLKAGALTLAGASIGDASNVLNTAVTSLTATASAGSIFLADLDDLQVNSASSAGTLQLFAGNAASAGSLTLGSLDASESVLLVGSLNIASLPGATITTPVAELRAGILARGSGTVSGQVGQLSAPVRFGASTTAVDLYLPVKSVAEPTAASIDPAIDGPPILKPTIHTFSGGGPAFFLTGLGSVNSQTLGGASLVGIGSTEVQSLKAANETNGSLHGDTQVLYVDWSAFDPSISLFGTLTPALKLPADQLDEEETSWIRPTGYTIVLTAQGGWKVVPVFRNRIAQIDTVRAHWNR